MKCPSIKVIMTRPPVSVKYAPMHTGALHSWLPWIQVVCWTFLLIGLVWRRRIGRWKRPRTFNWAIGLMTAAIVLSATAAILQLYGQ